MREIILQHKESFLVGIGALLLMSLVLAIIIILRMYTKKNTSEKKPEEKKEKKKEKYRKPEELFVPMESIQIHCLIPLYMMPDMMFM